MYYTKYRPQKFSEISKPNDSAIALQNQIKSKKTVHAYMFVGPRGTGKTTTARILAKALNCANLSKDGDPCDKCDACIAIKNGSYLDLIESDAASNRGIDDIRQLREKIKLAPSKGKNKVYIIDEVHMLTTEAFNALLKTLEEPPSKVSFILCTTEFQKVPDTIKSRCQIFKFKRATISQLVEKLKNICEKEKVEMEDDVLKQIASASYGGFRDAETLLQQIIDGEIKIGLLTNLISLKSFVNFVDLIMQSKVKESFHFIGKLYEDGVDLYVWVGEFLKYLRNIMFVQTNSSIDELEFSDELIELIKNQAKKIGIGNLISVMEIFIEAQSCIKSSYITQLPLELAVMKIYNKGYFFKENDSDLNNNGNFEKQTSRKEEFIEKKEKVKLDENPKDNTPVLELSIIISKWNAVIKEVSSQNHGISALLKSSSVKNIEGKIINLEVPFDFYKERLESTKNRDIVEKVFLDIYEKEIFINCCVKRQEKKKNEEKTSGRLTDYNLIPSNIKNDKTTSELLGMLDGNLPFSQ
ncbi:DNA polymerase III, subunit gamma and tau [candidate division WWE3 bacterium RBG_19FT_COMBO_34_6]|uniref:DNA polymerase III subunit gamma/tau n=1 Tax=candidate division WWE3 bacterium RBG_19FT_COMBO_34_6 TaxID=1802612 RepID=A0A1F4UMX5_UNCKA|nr:MAG: DNA polymerase III, subunit gamma and tau [candidate division WWE3 bacterium RBG_19FT_COMBO_34_6]